MCSLQVLTTLDKIIDIYPRCNCFIYDRSCCIHREAQTKPALAQIKFWTVDRFHANGHVRSCQQSPLNVQALNRRLAGVNTAVAEQVFSWFRGYARTFNEMRPARHSFVVLCYCRMHNELVAKNQASHLNPKAPTGAE